VSDVRWVPLERVEANDYNPNKVAANELKLLLHSILSDGYTQPVVTIYDAPRDRYVIVDGFHRWLVMKRHQAVQDMTGGLLPIVVLDKPLADRMASTVRHNRARGKHSVAGMSTIVFGMLDSGLTDEQVCAELGLEPDELLRLKHITGFSKLFADVEYNRAWQTRRMIQLRKEYETENGS
jgi:ParB-like chromosome segregation protein Spo0J